MGKLIFSVLAGYGVFVSLLALHVITPLVDSVDARLGANASVRLIVPGDIPLPSSLVRQFRSAVRQRRDQALLASRRIAALARQAPDTWA